MAGLLAALIPLALLGWAVCQIGGVADREEAQRRDDRPAEPGSYSSDERAVADNLDV